MKRMACSAVLVAVVLWVSSACIAAEPGFTQEDRERMVRLEASFQTFIHQVDKRFEELRRDMDKRSELMEKSIEGLRRELGKRIDDLREDMNKRFEQVDKRFEQVDKRFEQVDKRFEQFLTFVWILVGIFSTLTAVVIGFAYWDRRTIIKRARDEAIEDIEKEGRVRDFIRALRALASEEPKLAEVLKRFHLL